MSLFLWLMWSHQTFFTNRFGQVTFKDVSFMMFNMFIMVFLSNSLYPDFEKTFFPFFLCVAIMYLSIGLQYLLHIRTGLDYGDKRTCQAFASVAFVISFLSFIIISTTTKYPLHPWIFRRIHCSDRLFHFRNILYYHLLI